MFKPAVNQTIILFHSISILYIVYKLPSSASLAHSKSCLLRRFFASLCTYFSVSWSVCFCHPTCSLYICLCFILVPRVLLYSMPAKPVGLADPVTHRAADPVTNRALHFSVAWYCLEDMPCLAVGISLHRYILLLLLWLALVFYGFHQCLGITVTSCSFMSAYLCLSIALLGVLPSPYTGLK